MLCFALLCFGLIVLDWIMIGLVWIGLLSFPSHPQARSGRLAAVASHRIRTADSLYAQ
jgi:hypothetical protein